MSSLYSTSSVNLDRVARPNNTSGGHSLAKDGLTVYDEICLSPQLQPSKYIDGNTKHKIPRKPMPRNEGKKSTNHRPNHRDSNLASQKLSNQNSYETTSNRPTHSKARPKFSLFFSSDIQNGPRPPPWGSDNDLELHRRIRRELRDRAQNFADDAPALTYQKLHGTERLSEGLSREVEECRQQILSVYPDMPLYANVGEDKGGCTCCVVI